MAENVDSAARRTQNVISFGPAQGSSLTFVVFLYWVGCQPVFVPQSGEILGDQRIRLFRDRSSLVQQVPDLVPQRADAPAFDTAHFWVKIAFEAVLQRNQLCEMAPAQLLRQRRNNSFIGKSLSEGHHSRQAGPGETISEFRRQRCRQCLHNLLAIISPFTLRHILANPFADLPVHANQSRVDGTSSLFTGGFDQRAGVAEQVGADTGAGFPTGESGFAGFLFRHVKM